MKLLMENWKRFLNEAFVSGEPKEVYEKIRDWAFKYEGLSIEQLGLKQPQAVPSGRTHEVLTHMLNKLEPYLDKIESMGGITIHFDGVTSEDLAPFFEFDYKSNKPQKTGDFKPISLNFNPGDKTAKITFSENDFKNSKPPLPFIDPTTGDVKGVEPREDYE